MTARVYDRNWNEVAEPKMIWADRLAIALFLLTGGLVGMVYAFWGDPGTFVTCEQVSAFLTFGVWFAARVLDFIFTGRIRYGTV